MKKLTNPIFGDAGIGDWDTGELSPWEIREHEEELRKGARFKENTGPRYPKGTYQTEALKRARKRLPKDLP